MSEAARLLGVSRQRVYQLVGMGFLRTVKRGGQRRIPIEAIKDRKAAKLRLLGRCMSTRDVAEFFNVDPKTVRTWRDLGLIHSTKINNHLCFDPDEINVFEPPGHRVRRIRAERKPTTQKGNTDSANSSPEEA